MNSNDHYEPGTCNIGDDELSKRKKELIVGLIATFIFTVLFFNYPDSLFLLVFLFISTAFTVLMYLQIKNRFCVAFGWFKKYNFGKLGEARKITDPGYVSKDRKKVLIIGLQILVMALLYTALICWLAGYFIK